MEDKRKDAHNTNNTYCEAGLLTPKELSYTDSNCLMISAVEFYEIFPVTYMKIIKFRGITLCLVLTVIKL